MGQFAGALTLDALAKDYSKSSEEDEKIPAIGCWFSAVVSAGFCMVRLFLRLDSAPPPIRGHCSPLLLALLKLIAL